MRASLVIINPSPLTGEGLGEGLGEGENEYSVLPFDRIRGYSDLR